MYKGTGAAYAVLILQKMQFLHSGSGWILIANFSVDCLPSVSVAVMVNVSGVGWHLLPPLLVYFKLGNLPFTTSSEPGMVMVGAGPCPSTLITPLSTLSTVVAKLLSVTSKAGPGSDPSSGFWFNGVSSSATAVCGVPLICGAPPKKNKYYRFPRTQRQKLENNWTATSLK